MKTRIAFLIRSLELGGAERQLTALARGLDPHQFETTVYCFYPVGPLLAELEESGIRVVSLGKTGRWDIAKFVLRLATRLRRDRPHVVHSFMGPPNLIALLLRPWAGRPRVIWGIRASNMNLADYDATWRLTFALERLLSRCPDAIIANSYAGREHLVASGFSAKRLDVVPNGIDMERFDVDRDVGQPVRCEWKHETDDILIGLVARFDSKKDHAGFLRAAAIVVKTHPDARFVLVGGAGRVERADLSALADSLGLNAGRLVWAGSRIDVPAVYAALDIHVSASAYGEGFPNAVGEAMAARLPCVVTDVGDSAAIVGDCGIVVPPRDPQALAAGIEKLISLSAEMRGTLGGRARERIATNFSEPLMIARMARHYLAVPERRRGGGPTAARPDPKS